MSSAAAYLSGTRTGPGPDGWWGPSFAALVRNVAGPFAWAATIGALLCASDRWRCRGLAPAAGPALQLPLAALAYLLLRQFRLQSWAEAAHILGTTGTGRSRWLR